MAFVFQWYGIMVLDDDKSTSSRSYSTCKAKMQSNNFNNKSGNIWEFGSSSMSKFNILP